MCYNYNIAKRAASGKCHGLLFKLIKLQLHGASTKKSLKSLLPQGLRISLSCGVSMIVNLRVQLNSESRYFVSYILLNSDICCDFSLVMNKYLTVINSRIQMLFAFFIHSHFYRIILELQSYRITDFVGPVLQDFRLLSFSRGSI